MAPTFGLAAEHTAGSEGEPRHGQPRREEHTSRGAGASAASVIPPGWTYNPSRWSERLPLVALACLGFCIACYTSLYQWGTVSFFWDPFFGQASSFAVTHSKIAHILPFPDGTLGIPGYACDILFGALGGIDRWRRMPWVVLCFAGTITGLAVVSTLLTITMGVLVHQWCTMCLGSASVSIIVFSMGLGEVLATLQYLKRVWVRKRSIGAVWRAILGRG